MHKVQITFDRSILGDETDEIFVESLNKANKQNSILPIITQLKFLCYLYDGYFYQSDMKDILGRSFDCLAIIKSIEKNYVEIEVVAIYMNTGTSVEV